jgi:hypothetical protein
MTGVSIRDRAIRGAIVLVCAMTGILAGASHAHGWPALLLALIIVAQFVSVLHKRPTFIADGSTFTAPYPALSFLAVAILGGFAVGTVSSADSPVELAVSLTLTVAVALPVVLTLWWQPPAVVLTRDGILLRRLAFGSRFTRWDALNGPVGVLSHEMSMEFIINGVPERLFPGTLATDYRYIADAIEYYRVHPEARAAIGDAAEQPRLLAALQEWAAAYWGVRAPR